MRFSIDLAVVAALTVSVSTASTRIPAVGSVNDDCPFLCLSDVACTNCWMGHECASLPWMQLSCQGKSDSEAGTTQH